LSQTGASFFDPLHEALGGGYPGETIERCGAWSGAASSPTTRCMPLRAYIARRTRARTRKRMQTGVAFRSRRTTPPTAQGRWSLRSKAAIWSMPQ
jgi:ATP-dependent Lhr-like helicase